MKRPQRIAFGLFSSLLLVALLVTVQQNRTYEYTGDPYEHEVTGEIVCPEIVVSDLMEEECGEDEPPCEEVCEADGPPELGLPTGKLYADRRAPSFPAGSGVTFGEPVACANKTLIPLYPDCEAACVKSGFLTLAEAVESGQARVVDSGSVQSVYIVNESEQPIFLMCSEVIYGGKQDRVIAQDTIIPAEKDKKFHIGVFCVEKSRWQQSDRGFAFTCKPEEFKAELARESRTPEATDAPGTQQPVLAQAEESSKWEQIYQNLAGKGITCACILAECDEGGQSEVWSRVDKTNRRLGTDNATNTYRNNLTSGDVNERMKEELGVFCRAMAQDDRAVGYVFLLDGNVLYVDIFGSAELFAKYKYGLIKAYLLDTVNQECDSNSSPTAANPAAFLEWVETRRLPEKSRPGYAFYKSGFLVGSDCTYEGKRLHSGYYHDGLSSK